MQLIPLTFFKCLLTSLVIFSTTFSLVAQDSGTDEDAFFIRKIYDEALENPMAHRWLDYLCNKIGGRLAGSPQAEAAVAYTAQMLDTIGITEVRLQPCEVPHWERGIPEVVKIVNSKTEGDIVLKALALGNSIGTGAAGLIAEVIEVQTLDEVEALGKEKVEGKIVFYNRPMDPKQIRTFNAYGGAADQRVN